MSVRIIVDSTADLTKEVKERLSIVPLTIIFGEEEYVDGVTITHQEFYEKLVEGDELPSTSQATPAAFDREFRKVAEAGDDAVVITVSSELSGTYQSAVIAAADYEGRIFVVDGRTVTLGTGILAEYALQLADQGLSAEVIAEKVTKKRDKVHMIALLDTLEYLKKGGRISATAAFAGGLLSLKPVICIRNGVIESLGKARGSKQGNNLLVKEIQAAGGVDFSKPVLLGYTGLDDSLLRKYMKDSASLWEEYKQELRTTIIGSVVGTHAGPGVVAVAFFAKDPEN